ncbi:MAG: hypothetical protein A3J93_01365 [Candidatus Magasanikbacteria bacterium RIFOXYC2_FULL_42_28]|uniref:Uncharacterized protein n=1 Tax=Candidatus Magasanikbacteria bacterium RIFOXYC2_FULL_42_28 TaxID=1798704 RepID=A0A1F6NXR4_9BACT|nr:MAG: hypothetical protein A3J93_01365 [Candidatus Magasanikbacteria bacterium RIFOXYC2_FULL_42_28]
MPGEKRPTPNPPEAKYLIRNLERRRRLLARFSEKKSGEIPELVIKDTLLKFLDKSYNGKTSEEIVDFNKRIYMLLNRSASLPVRKQDTAPVTSMYAYQQKGARRINEQTYKKFLSEVKKIIELCQEHGISLKSITGMQNGLGVPDTGVLDKLLQWCADKKVDLKSITGMQMGIPTVEVLSALLGEGKLETIQKI